MYSLNQYVFSIRSNEHLRLHDLSLGEYLKLLIVAIAGLDVLQLNIVKHG
jgi:hypothetical protein